MPISTFKSVFLFMKFIQGKPRNQWEMYCLDTHVDADNEVRLIDLFVDSRTCPNLGLRSIMRKMAGRLTILELCFAFSFTATSTVSVPADNSKRNANATWNSCGS